MRVESFLSEVGTLELSLHVTEEALRRFKLAFSTRTEASVSAEGAPPPGAVPKGEALHKRIEEGRDLVLTFFGNKSKDVDKGKVKDLRREASALKEVVAELTLENRLLKKSVTADGEDGA